MLRYPELAEKGYTVAEMKHIVLLKHISYIFLADFEQAARVSQHSTLTNICLIAFGPDSPHNETSDVASVGVVDGTLVE